MILRIFLIYSSEEGALDSKTKLVTEAGIPIGDNRKA